MAEEKEQYRTGGEGEMSFLDHLEELRWRLIKALIGIVAGAVICGIFIDWIMNNFLLAPATKTEPPIVLINLKPYGQLVLYMEVILVGGIVLSVPNLFYQLWKFIEPGLLPSERKYISWIVFFSTFCFLGGLVFAYYIMIPTALKFFAAFGTQAISNNIAINEYFSFVISVLITAGIVFELPMVSFFLSKLGILTPKFMRKYRKHALVIILLLAGILTPSPDVTSQLLLGVPLFILYELSILISKFSQPKPAD
ncbi:MAG: twin-arginine translocase subunit TatC [Chlorobi bacterium]|nr:twin-arginine translocase subunit TatC [Chlorobiota bacterium]MCI0715237.1 twin-arginine translocase subunit TatC [Chlorobiota bacterium]